MCSAGPNLQPGEDFGVSIGASASSASVLAGVSMIPSMLSAL